MEQPVTANRVDELDGSIRDLFKKVDPTSKMRLGLSITGLDEWVQNGFNTAPIILVLSRFAETVGSPGLARNISIYLWAGDRGVLMRVAHDGRTDWAAEMRAWVAGSTLGCELEQGDAEVNNMTISFPWMGGR